MNEIKKLKELEGMLDVLSKLSGYSTGENLFSTDWLKKNILGLDNKNDLRKDKINKIFNDGKPRML